MAVKAMTTFMPTVCDAYRYFAGHALLMTLRSRSLTEYLLQTDNTIVLIDTPI